jgi:hypothetical protein
MQGSGIARNIVCGHTKMTVAFRLANGHFFTAPKRISSLSFLIFCLSFDIPILSFGFSVVCLSRFACGTLVGIGRITMNEQTQLPTSHRRSSNRDGQIILTTIGLVVIAFLIARIVWQAEEISTLKTRLDALTEEKTRDDARREREQARFLAAKPRQVAVRKPARVVDEPEDILKDETLDSDNTADSDAPEPRLKDVPDLGLKPERQWDEALEAIPDPSAKAPAVDKRRLKSPVKNPVKKLRQMPAPPLLRMGRRLPPGVQPFAK